MTSRDWRPGIPGRYYSRRDKTDAEGGFGEEYWRDIADPDGNRRDLTTERLQHITDLKQELNFVNDLTPGRILDVGCGLGFFLSGVDERWEKHGVELSEFAAGFAREWAEVHVGTLEDGQFPDDHFDLVLCHHVIEHVDHPEGLLDEICRVLRPGGYLILGTPDFDSGCARRFGPKYRMLHDPTHINLFTHESIVRFARDRGFIVELVEFPFFDTRHFSKENLERLFDTEQTSPPFYGNLVALYCRKPEGGSLTSLLQQLGSFSTGEMRDVDKRAVTAIRMAVEAVEAGGHLWVSGTPRLRHFVEGPGGLTDSLRRVAWFSETDVLGNQDVLIVLSERGMPDTRGQGLDELQESMSARSVVICSESVIDSYPDSRVIISVPSRCDCSVGALGLAVLGALIDSAKDRSPRLSLAEAEL